MSIYRNPHIALALASLFWAGNAIVGKFSIGHVSPMAVTFLRWTIALAILSIFSWRHVKSDWPTIRANWKFLILMGGFGLTMFNFTLYSALKYTSAINVTIEHAATPLFIFIFSFIAYKTKITALQAVGYICTVLGVTLVVSHGAPWALFSVDSSSVGRGDLIMLLGCVFYAFYSVALRTKPTMHWQSFLTCIIVGALIFAAFGLVFEAATGTLMWPTDSQGIFSTLFAAIFPSLGSEALFVAGVAALGANRAAPYINLVPVFAAILAVFFLGEHLFTYHAIAFAMVVGGVMIAQRGSLKS